MSNSTLLWSLFLSLPITSVPESGFALSVEAFQPFLPINQCGYVIWRIVFCHSLWSWLCSFFCVNENLSHSFESLSCWAVFFFFHFFFCRRSRERAENCISYISEEFSKDSLDWREASVTSRAAGVQKSAGGGPSACRWSCPQAFGRSCMSFCFYKLSGWVDWKLWGWGAISPPPSLSLSLSLSPSLSCSIGTLLDRLLVTQLTCEMGFLIAVPFGGSSWFRKAKELAWACACTQNCHSQQWLGYCSSTIWVQDSECTYCPANNHQTISGSWLPFTLFPSAFPMQIKHFSCCFLLWWKRVCYQ